MSANSLQRKNSDTIANAFNSFQLSVDSRCKLAMETMCADAMKYALEIHDEEHHRHNQIGDSYGWIVLYDKTAISTGTNSGTERARIDFQQYMEHIYSSAQIPMGWVGVIVAGMSLFGYFSVKYELGIIEDTKEYVRTNFKRIFNSIK